MSCGAPSGTMCPNCDVPVPPEAEFCPSCGTAVGRPDDQAPEMIKLATTLFADVVGSTALGERLGPDELRALLAELFGMLSEEIIIEDGTIEKVLGDAITGVFGVPVTHEDDACRAVKTGLRMLERVEQMNASRPEEKRLQIRIGINTGEVSAEGSFAPQLLVVGDSVNVAARLESAAEPGTILIGERTARAVRDLFHLREVEPISAKGKTQPVKAYVVEGKRDAPHQPLSFAPMVGRQGELEILGGIFSGTARESSAHLVITLGEPGLGKSRLVTEFLSSIRDPATIVQSACLPYGEGVTLWPLRDILGALAGFRIGDPPSRVRFAVSELVATFGDVDDADRLAAGLMSSIAIDADHDPLASLDPRQLRAEIFQAWQTFLSAVSERQPLVVVVDDLHWADEMMLELLSHLVASVRGPVLFLCPSRPEILVSRAGWIASMKRCSIIRLEPLGDAELQELMFSLVGNLELPDTLRARLVEKVGGNPFFLSEILRQLTEESILEKGAAGWQLTGEAVEVVIPDNVQSVILARLDRLSSDEKRAIQRASVIGGSFSRDALAALCEGAHLDEILRTLQQRELIGQDPARQRDGASYTFKHMLIRDVAYETLPRRIRGEIHAQLVVWIEDLRSDGTQDVAEILAHHSNMAYELLDDPEFRLRARVYYLTAARAAARRLAAVQAEQLVWQAVDLAAEPNDRIDALETAAEIYFLGGKSEAAWAVYTDALKEVRSLPQPDPRAVGRICAGAAIIPTRQWGSVEETPADEEIQTMIDLGLEAVGDGESASKALLLVSKAFFDAESGRSEDAFRAANEALAVAERLDDADLMSAALDALSACHMHPHGRYVEVRRITERRMGLIRRLSDLSEVCDVYGMAAVSETLIGIYRQAVEHATESAEIGRHLDVGSYLHALNWRVHARFMAGDWDGAIADEATIARLEDRELISLPGGYSARSAMAILFCMELREHPEAAARLDVMRDYRRESERSINVGPLGARALAHMGLIEEAWDWIDLSRRMYRAAHLEAACEVVAAEQDWERASDIIQQARRETADCGLLALGSFADRLEGRRLVAAADAERAATLLSRSAEGFAQIGAPWEEAFSRLLLAESVAASDEDEAGRQVLRAAPVFERLGSVQELARIRDLLRTPA